jgi:cytochrome c-type biogenesis protein CcmH/NrfF
MQQSGVDDSSIVAAFVKELGEKVFRPDPGPWFWLVPYFALGAGGLLLVFRLRKMIDRGQRQPLVPQRDRSDVDLAHCIEAVSESTERLD